MNKKIGQLYCMLMDIAEMHPNMKFIGKDGNGHRVFEVTGMNGLKYDICCEIRKSAENPEYIYMSFYRMGTESPAISYTLKKFDMAELDIVRWTMTNAPDSLVRSFENAY